MATAATKRPHANPALMKIDLAGKLRIPPPDPSSPHYLLNSLSGSSTSSYTSPTHHERRRGANIVPCRTAPCGYALAPPPSVGEAARARRIVAGSSAPTTPSAPPTAAQGMSGSQPPYATVRCEPASGAASSGAAAAAGAGPSPPMHYTPHQQPHPSVAAAGTPNMQAGAPNPTSSHHQPAHQGANVMLPPPQPQRTSPSDVFDPFGGDFGSAKPSGAQQQQQQAWGATQQAAQQPPQAKRAVMTIDDIFS